MVRFVCVAVLGPSTGQRSMQESEWAEPRQLLWAVVGNGSAPLERLEALQRSPRIPWKPSHCVLGAVSLHLLQTLQQTASARHLEIASGGELLQVLLQVRWTEVAAQGWPVFGLLHLLQMQLAEEADELVKGGPQVQTWQLPQTDDHVRFRNWVYSHLQFSQIPPLVDAIHFIARADPREAGDPVKECSAAKAMGYLATAWTFVNENDEGSQRQGGELVDIAEGHVKSCANLDANFTLMGLLTTDWNLWWILHVVLTSLHPVVQSKPEPLRPQKGTAPVKSQADICDGCSSHVVAEGLHPMSEAVKREFADFGDGVFVIELSALEAKLGLKRGQFVQLYRNNAPLRRLPRSSVVMGRPPPDHMGPAWALLHVFSSSVVCITDPDFLRDSYSISTRDPIRVGIYAEPLSAQDPYNAEWLQAFQAAILAMDVDLHYITDPTLAAQAYFWRINQMFQGGRWAGQAGVGAAIAEHLQTTLGALGAVPWPRPETAVFYQDKIALKQLFEQVEIPAPRSWIVENEQELMSMLRSGILRHEHFPVVLKHPYAASSRGMASCATVEDAPEVISKWLAEHRVPCLVQHRVQVAKDMRITYIGGEIIHGYWRLKASSEELSSGTGFGSSRLDFNIPRAELAPFVREFARRTGLDIGGMDIAFPLGSAGPVVFEVSPTFDLNPEPPPKWQSVPYAEYKKTDDYIKRRADSYQECARQMIVYALNRRHHVYVDIDNTVNNAWERLRRAALPSWPGQTFDAGRAFDPKELARDAPVADAAQALLGLTRDWEVSFLSARGSPGLYSPTVQWLQQHGFAYSQVILVSEAQHKVAWLVDGMADAWLRNVRLVLIDDLARGYHQATPEIDEEVVQQLQRCEVPFEVFRPGSTSWAELARQLTALAGPGGWLATSSSAPAGPGPCSAFSVAMQ
eukprot:CAMPEP_0178459134 /NCGR_PEP_ID=MMETSP0689_2-20121128/47947_1 /TAXON_ID=160604 /ORGANISM="Amphidinium massartii, Strain CS-259" /LENGTH=914 /DNA_ID=CAMNT_0020085549 /DNA_START=47 /DNA_END=2793 /DNA_ORIENTATION=+